MAKVTPARDEQLDLFVASLVDAPLRDARDTMERPFFALSKSRRAPISYEAGDLFVRVSSPSAYGLATIYDADILIWCASQITDAINRGMKHGPRLQFMPYDLLRAIKRGTGGKDYAELRAALRRLTATTVETNVRVPEGTRAAMFHWLERWTEEADAAGNTKGMVIELPRWIYEAILEARVLAVHPGYFQITSGLARWLYRVVRKHAGNQEAGWAFTLRTLYDKSGSTQRFSDFARQLRQITDLNALPEYHLSLYRNDQGQECLHAVRRQFLADDHPAADRELLQARGRRRTRPAVV